MHVFIDAEHELTFNSGVSNIVFILGLDEQPIKKENKIILNFHLPGEKLYKSSLLVNNHIKINFKNFSNKKEAFRLW